MNSSNFNTWIGAILSALLLLFAVRTVIEERKELAGHPKAGWEVAELKEGEFAAEAAVPDKPDPPVAEVLKVADADTGKNLSKACMACHSFEKGGPNKVGPNLYGVVGGKVGGHDGFAYSEPMKGKGGNWGYDDLYKFLANPKAVVPGTKMTFAGMKKPEDRASLLAYLRTLSDAPVPLP